MTRIRDTRASPAPSAFPITRDETYVAGNAHHGRPGHLPLIFADTELIEFSSTDALDTTTAVIRANLAASTG